MATDVINDPSEDRWDVRPVPRYGTIEMRYCDGSPPGRMLRRSWRSRSAWWSTSPAALRRAKA